MVTAPDSGSPTPEPYAFFDRATSSLRTSQHSLLEDSGESCTTFGKQGMWDAGGVYELPISEHLTSASVSSSLLATPMPSDVDGGRTTKGSARQGETGLRRQVLLLPTPSAYESTPTDEYVEEIQENLEDPHKRLYLPGRKYHAQRTLSRTSGRKKDSKHHDGTTLTDAIWETQGRTEDTRGNLLPTPTAQDGKNNAGPSQYLRNSDPLNVVAAKVSPGEYMTTPSPAGNRPSDGPPPDQLTIGDD